MGNEIEHVEGEGEVVFQVNGDCGELSVSDYGTGFPPDSDSQRSATTGLESGWADSARQGAFAYRRSILAHNVKSGNLGVLLLAFSGSCHP